MERPHPIVEKSDAASILRFLRHVEFVGSMTETGTTDVSRLTIGAGAGIKFAVSSPNGASLSYVLAKAEMARFEKALVQAKDFLSK
jgi:hypothetical protein